MAIWKILPYVMSAPLSLNDVCCLVPAWYTACYSPTLFLPRPLYTYTSSPLVPFRYTARLIHL